MTNHYLLKKLDYDKIELAILGLLVQRKRLYEAHYVALEVVSDLLLPLAGREFIITRSHIQERLQVTDRVSRSALDKLIDAGIIIETQEAHLDEETFKRIARRFKFSEAFYTAEVPMNHWDGVTAFKTAGGSQEQYSTVKRMLEGRGSRVSVTEVLDELARINSITAKKKFSALYFGGPAAMDRVI